jgi:hypothetical protein
MTTSSQSQQTAHLIEGMSFIVRVTPMTTGGWLWSARGEDGMTGWITGDIFCSAESARCAAIATLTRRFS